MPAGHDPAAPPLLVFADDWGRHPSSCQHLVQRLLPRYDVWWVNTIGTRPPSWNLATMRRGAEKISQWLQRSEGAGETTSSNPRVVNPRMWPWFRRRYDRWLNERLLINALQPVLETMRQPPQVLTTLPIVADLVGKFPAASWTYYCVDDFSLWPGLDQKPLECLEAELIAKCDRLIAVSECLRERLRTHRPVVEMLTHGVDVEFWQPAGAALPPPWMLETAGPRIVFWGVIDPRMDTEWIARLASELTAGTIWLVGPAQDPDPQLAALPRVRWHPAVGLAELPQIAAQADVLIMPYRDLPVTQAMQPLKLKEYLATGKPAVVRDLPSTREWAGAADLASTAEEFSRLVLERVGSGLPEEQRRERERLQTESWDAKARRLEVLAGWIDEPKLVAGGLPAAQEPTRTIDRQCRCG